MNQPRILMLSIYPIAEPQYGGPKRSRAIYEALRAHFSAVAYVAVHPNRGGMRTGRDDIAVSPETQDRIDAQPYLADLICGDAIHADPSVKRRLAGFLARFAPDIIVVEQLYPFLGLEPLLDELDLRPRIVFSSQNIEHDMKPAIYTSFGVGQATVESLTRRIREPEERLATRSALAIAVSGQDLDALRAMGAQQTVLAPNGTSPVQASRGAIEQHRRRLDRRQVHSTVVFVSSAHQPNVQGFIDMVGTKLGFLPWGVCLLICGSVSDLMGGRIAADDAEQVTFWQRAMSLGTMSEDELGAVLLSADAVILPITQGGGSNLKTAEALVSGRPIVATTFAFRGYEEYLGLPGVHVADTPAAFRTAILQALEQPPQARSADEADMVRRLSWDQRLAPIVEALGGL